MWNAISLAQDLNSNNFPIDGTLTGTITPDQNGPGSNGNVEVLHIPQSSRTAASQSDPGLSYIEYTHHILSLPTGRLNKWLQTNKKCNLKKGKIENMFMITIKHLQMNQI